MSAPFFQRVMVAYAGDPLDAALLLSVRALTRTMCPSQVHVVNVSEDETQTVSPGIRLELMDKAVRAALIEVPGPIVTCAVLRGPILDALLSYTTEQRIDLAIVGHRPAGRPRSLARRLARRATCAVWMLPLGTLPVTSRILVPTDFSETAGRALDAALALCRAQHLHECLVVNVVCRATEGPSPGEPPDKVDRQRALAGHDTAGVNVTFIREEAEDVATGVVRVAARMGADLVCMGARGRSRAAAVLLGSATEDVLERVDCPVLVIRDAERPLSVIEVLARRVFSEDDRPRSIG